MSLFPLSNYTKSNYVNNTAPAINATNKNKIEDRLELLTDGSNELNTTTQTNATGVATAQSTANAAQTTANNALTKATDNETDISANANAINTLNATKADQTDLDAEETARISGDSGLQIQINNFNDQLVEIISETDIDPNKDPEVTNGRNSSEYGTFETLKERLDNTDNLKAEKSTIKNSDYSDADRFVGNTKAVDDFQDLTGYVSGGGAVVTADNAIFKIEKQSMKVQCPDNSVRSLYVDVNNVSFDLSKLSNGNNSSDDDFIYVPLYLSDVNDVSLIEISFSQGLTYDAGNRKVIQKSTGLISGWNYLKLKKSNFITSGSGAWSGIQSYRCLWQSKLNAQNEYVNFGFIYLYKADPENSMIPNVFQENGKRVYEINSEFSVFREFGKNTWRNLNPLSTFTALIGTKPLSVFEAIHVAESNQSATGTGCIWRINDTNYISAFIASNTLNFRKVFGGSATTETKSLTLAKGDAIRYDLKKTATKAHLQVYKNNELIPVELSLDVAFTEAGYFAPYQASTGNSQNVISNSITELSYSSKSVYATRAGSLNEQARARIYNSANQSIPNNALTDVVYNTIDVDNRNHFNSSLNTVITCRENGFYDILARIRFDNNPTGYRRIVLFKNGIAFASKIINAVNGGVTDADCFAMDIRLKVGDTIKCQVFQNSGASLNIINPSENYTNILSFRKVS